MTEHAIKHNHKPTATPPSTVIVAADNHSLPPFYSLAFVPSLSPGAAGGEEEHGRVIGGGGEGGRKGARGRRGGGGRITFYFDGKG